MRKIKLLPGAEMLFKSAFMLGKRLLSKAAFQPLFSLREEFFQALKKSFSKPLSLHDVTCINGNLANLADNSTLE